MRVLNAAEEAEQGPEEAEEVVEEVVEESRSFSVVWGFILQQLFDSHLFEIVIK